MDLEHLANHFPLLQELSVNWFCWKPPALWLQLARMPQLRALELSRTSDADLETICTHESLVSLDFQDCDEVTASGLAHFPRLTALQSLRLCACPRIGDSGAERIGGILSLRTLLVSLARISDAGLRRLSGLTALEELNIIGCTFLTDAGMGHLSGLGRLHALCAGGCVKSTDQSLRHVASVKGLTRLEMHGMHVECVCGAGFQHLAALPALQVLCLCDTPVQDSSVVHLHALRSLRDLDLSRTLLSDIGMPHLSALTGLSALSISGNDIMNDGVAHMRSLTALQLLDLDFTRISDAGIAQLTGLTALTKLHLRAANCTPRCREILSHIMGLDLIMRE